MPFRAGPSRRTVRMAMNLQRKQLVRGAMAAGWVAALAFLGGCSDGRMKTAPVKGTITYKGKPVPQGSIMFQPEQGPAATADITNGSYVLKTYKNGDGAVLGKH